MIECRVHGWEKGSKVKAGLGGELLKGLAGCCVELWLLGMMLCYRTRS
jgi:hypothetical protein